MTLDSFQALIPLFVLLAVVGLGSGFLAGLFGIGGGAILVPALFELFTRLDVPEDVRTHLAIGTSLAVILPTAVRSVMAHHDRGAVEWDVLKRFGPWVVVGTAGGAVIADLMSGKALTLAFAVLASLTGLNMALRGESKVAKERKPLPSLLPTAFLGLWVGGFSALMGIGGGTFAVLLLSALGRGIREAVATGAGFGILIAIPGAISFAGAGWGEPGLPPGSIGYVSGIGLLALAPTSLLAAHWGAAAAHKLNRSLLRRFFGVFLLIVAGRLVYAALFGGN